MTCMRAMLIGGVMAAFLAGMTSTSMSADEGTDDAPGDVTSRITAKPPRDFPDVRLASDPNVSEQSWSVAVRPGDPARLLAAISRAHPENDCVTRASSDGGKTWQPAVKLSIPTATCADAVVAYAPDGSRAYATYTRSRLACGSDGACSGDIVFSSSVDDGATWSAPVLAIDAGENDYISYVKPKLATPIRKEGRKYIYLVATASYGLTGHYSQIFFTRSGDGGRTWSTPQSMARSDYLFGGADNYSVAGGLKGEVLVTWDYSDYTGLKQIIAQTSNNFGATFDSPVVAVKQADRLPRVPDVKIGPTGVAYIAYEAFYPAKADSSIQYVSSSRAPYRTWTSPANLSGEIAGHRYHTPALAIDAQCEAASILNVTWLDDRTNVFYTRLVGLPGYTASRSLRVSNLASPVGEQPAFSSVTAGGGQAFAIWTDRRPVTDINDYGTNVYGSRIDSGVVCR